MELSEIRARIDRVDDQMLELFLKRMALSEEVAAYKKERGLPILNRDREQEILDKVAQKAGDKGQYARRLYSTLFALSRERQAELIFDRPNLLLVGMPGCGKTTVGRVLARIARRPFVDLDDEIVRLAGRSIPEIFDRDGEEAFRELESRVLAGACAGSGQVIATGGGTVLRPENRAAMGRAGRVYWLRRDLALLPTAGRPLSQAGSLEEMYRLRKPLYAEAGDAEADNNATPEEAAEAIWRDFCKIAGD